MSMINPVLIVGLGGSGREVILRIKRSFYERGIRVQPWIKYLWIDTAVAVDRDKYLAGTSGNDYISTQIALTDDEVCDIGVTRDECRVIETEFDNYKSIWEWADRATVNQVLQGDVAEGLKHGASQTPPLGRLAFFLKSQDVKNKLIFAASRLAAFSNQVLVDTVESGKIVRADPAIARMLTLPVGRSKVLICGSLAGGTGSGLCVDVAAMLRATDSAGTSLFFRGNPIANSSIFAYFLLPDVYTYEYDNYKRNEWHNFVPARVAANGYAMLQEIERLSFTGHSGMKADEITGRGETERLLGSFGASRMKATWNIVGTAVDDAPLIPLPLYDTVYLFDGTARTTGHALNRLRDSFDLLAGLIFADVLSLDANAKALSQHAADDNNGLRSNSRGHLETHPAMADNVKVPVLWGELYSFVFASAGFARVTADAPRTRLMAAYRIAIKSLNMWMGSIDPFLKPDSAAVGRALEDQQRTRKLIEAMETEIIPDFLINRRDGAAGKVSSWGAYLRAQHPWKLLADVEQGKADSGWTALCDRIQQEAAPAIPSQYILESFNKYYLRADGSEGEIQKFLSRLINDPTLPGKSGLPQAGVLTALFAVTSGVDSDAVAEGAILRGALKLAKTLKDMATRRAQEIANSIEEAKQAAREADRLANLFASANFWVTSSIRARVKEKAQQTALNASKLLKVLAQKRNEEVLAATLGEAWAQWADLKKSPQVADEFKAARAQLRRTHWFLSSLVSKTDTGPTPVGLTQIFDSLRKTDLGSLTLTVESAKNLQKHVQALDEEIARTFESPANLDSRLYTLQKVFVEQWGKLALRYAATSARAANVPDRIEHLANLDTLERNVPLLENRPLYIDSMIPPILEDQRIQRLLLDENNSYSAFSEITGVNAVQRRDDLLSMSQLRARLPDNLSINPRGLEMGKAIVAPDTTRKYTIGKGIGDKDSESVLPAFTHHIYDNPLEYSVLQQKGGIPLPNFSFCRSAIEKFSFDHLHRSRFFPDKSGYIPIHRVSEGEAREMMNRNVDVILAIMLGQIRPQKQSEAGQVRFAAFGDIMQAAPAWSNLRKTVGDILYYLQHRPSDLGWVLETFSKRNEALLNRMPETALLILHAIARYNVRYFQIPQSVTSDADTRYSRNLDLGSQSLILEAVERRVRAKLLERTGSPNMANLPERIFVAFNKIHSYLHHVSCFVPTRLYGNDAGLPLSGARRHPQHFINYPDGRDVLHNPMLLTMLVEVRRSTDTFGPGEKIRLEPLPKFQTSNDPLAGMQWIGPWALYTEGLGASTLTRHEENLKLEMPNQPVRDFTMDPSRQPGAASSFPGPDRAASISDKCVTGELAFDAFIVGYKKEMAESLY